MTTLTSSTGAAGFQPRDAGPLLVQPTLAASIFAQIATRQTTASHTYRILPSRP